jgi:DNA-directed RNA polymerase subunit K/omega
LYKIEPRTKSQGIDRDRMADEEGIDTGLGFDDEADVVENLEAVEAEVDDQGVPERTTVKESRALQFLKQHHPECRLDYVEEVMQKLPLAAYPPDSGSDPKHKGVPYLTLFEKTKIIGFRANQLSQGARPLIELPEYVTDVLEIARLELEQKRLPYILKRPFPDGSYEYIRLADLMII